MIEFVGVALLACTLALTRPSVIDRSREVAWFGQPASEIAKERLELWLSGDSPLSWYGPIPKDLSTSTMADYFFYTIITPKNKVSENRLLGIFGTFIPHKVRDDLVGLAVLLVLSFATAVIKPGFAVRVARPSLTRPWSFLATSFYSPSLVGTFMGASALVNSGLDVQKDVGRQSFLKLFFLPGVLTGAIQFIVKRHPQPVGFEGAILAVISYAALTAPDFRYQIYGVEVNGLGLMGIQAILTLGPLISSPRALMQRLPTFLSGVLVGACFFLLFHENQAHSLLKKAGVDQGTPIIIATALSTHVVFSIACYINA